MFFVSVEMYQIYWVKIDVILLYITTQTIILGKNYYTVYIYIYKLGLQIDEDYLSLMLPFERFIFKYKSLFLYHDLIFSCCLRQSSCFQPRPISKLEYHSGNCILQPSSIHLFIVIILTV